MARHEQYSLLLLAGGKSARMGTSKAELLFEGKTFLQHMLDKAKTLGIEKCYISGYTASQEDVTTVWDIYPNRGPLSGIHATMRTIPTPYCLVLPVDAPKLPVEILEGLLQARRNRRRYLPPHRCSNLQRYAAHLRHPAQRHAVQTLGRYVRRRQPLQAYLHLL